MRALFSARALFALSALFIFYATTIPWDFDHAPSVARVAWIPLWDLARGRPPSISDLVQNVVLFLPFGFFGALALPFVRRRSAISGALVIGLLGLSLSFLVEFLQTMSEERTPSASDLTTNFLGATIGGACAFLYARKLERRLNATLDLMARDRPGLLVFLAYAAVISLGALAPFIPTLDVSDLRANVRLLLDHPWGPKPIGALASDALSFAALGFLAAHELSLRRWRGPILGALAVSLLAIALEFLQLFIIDHSPGVQDAVAGIAGAIAGASLAAALERGPLLPAREPGELTERRPWLVLAFAILAPSVRALSPFVVVPLAEKLADFSAWQFVPFWAFFRNVNLSTVRNVFEAAVYYVPLGYALFALVRRPWVTFALAFVLADTLEVLQLPIEGRTFDATEGIYAGAGALAGAFVLLELRARRSLAKVAR